MNVNFPSINLNTHSSQKTSPSEPKIEKQNDFQMALDKNQLTEDMVSPEKVNTPLSNGMLPLHYAIYHCKPQTIKLLLDHADLQRADKDGLVAFDHAVHMSNKPLAEKIMVMSLKKEWEALKENCSKVKEVQQNERQKFEKMFGSYIVPWASRPEKLKTLYNKICLGDTKGAIELVMSDPTLLSTQMEKTKKTFLHLAVEKDNKALVFFFLQAIYQLPNATIILEKADANDKTAEQAAKNESIARIFEEFKAHDLSEETQKLFSEAVLPFMFETNAQMDRFKQATINVKQGFSGNNSWQVLAIQNSDYQAFIRNTLDGGNVSDFDQDTGLSLLHLAAKEGQLEIIYVLFKFGLNFGMKSAPPKSKTEGLTPQEGLTPLEMAQKENKTEAAALIAILQEAQTVYESDLVACLKNKKEIPAGLKECLMAVDNNVTQYAETYRKKQAEYTQEERTEKARIAKYGCIAHQEGSQGHHSKLLASIIHGKLDVLVAYGELGADLMTTSVSYSKAIEDPLWGGAVMTTLTKAKKITDETLDEVRLGLPEDDTSVVDKLNATLLGRKKGKGKSLLDMAVLYSKEGQDNLDIIAYLLSRKLDPFQLNDEGETPFSTALIKGNLKAANLMMHYADFAKGKSPALDEKSFSRALQFLSQGAKLRDPLYVNNAKLSGAILAGTYLLTQQFFGSQSYWSFIPHFLLMVGAGLIPAESYRERLTKKQETSPLPKIIQNAMPYAWRGSILDGFMPTYPVASLVYASGSLYGSAVSTLSSIKTSATYLVTRPIQALYKVGVDGIGLAKNVQWSTSLFTRTFFPPKAELPAERVCKKLDEKQYKGVQDEVNKANDELVSLRKEYTNLEERKIAEPVLRGYREKIKNAEKVFKGVELKRQEALADLDPQCLEHAKVILTGNWNETAFQENPKDYVNELFKPKKLFLHPDKGGDHNIYRNIFGATDTLQQKSEEIRMHTHPVYAENMKIRLDLKHKIKKPAKEHDEENHISKNSKIPQIAPPPGFFSGPLSPVSKFALECGAKGAIIWASAQQSLRKVPVVGVVTSPEAWSYVRSFSTWGPLAYQFGRPVASVAYHIFSTKLCLLF